MSRFERVDLVTFRRQDIQRAKRSYSELLGLEVETEGEHDMEFQCGQVTLDGFDPSSVGQAFAPASGGLALRVSDVARTRVGLEARGVELEGDTLGTGVCHTAFFKDPDGNSPILHRREAPFPDGREP